MIDATHTVFNSQMQLAFTNAVKFFQNYMAAAMPKEGYDLEFSTTVEKIIDQVDKWRQGIISTSRYPDETVKWDVSEYSIALQDQIQMYIADFRKRQIERALEEEKKCIQEQLESLVHEVTISSNPDLWVFLRATFSEFLNNLNNDLQEHFKGFNPTKDELKEFMEPLTSYAENFIRQKLSVFASIISISMQKRFDQKFKYNGNLLRTWNVKDDLRGIFAEARSHALVLLDLYFLFRLKKEEYDNIHLTIPTVDQPDEMFSFPRDSSLEPDLIMSDLQCTRTYGEMCVYMKSAYNEAEQKRMLASQSTVPWWIYIVIAVLGFDEFIYLLSHPFYLLVAVVLLAVLGYSILQKHLANFLETGNPTITVPLRMMLTRIPFSVLPSGGTDTSTPSGVPQPSVVPAITPSVTTPQQSVVTGTGDMPSASSLLLRVGRKQADTTAPPDQDKKNQ